MKVTMGYQHQDMSDCGGNCPCGDPGNYVAITIDGLDLEIRCWCGRKRSGKFDDDAERDAFLAKRKATVT
jgi:hypothetical protein